LNIENFTSKNAVLPKILYDINLLG